MGKLASHSRAKHRTNGRVAHLLEQRRDLSQRLDKINTELARVQPSSHKLNLAKLDRWLDQLSDGLPKLPSLPADFSRADLYDDHD